MRFNSSIFTDYHLSLTFFSLKLSSCLGPSLLFFHARRTQHDYFNNTRLTTVGLFRNNTVAGLIAELVQLFTIRGPLL